MPAITINTPQIVVGMNHAKRPCNCTNNNKQLEVVFNYIDINIDQNAAYQKVNNVWRHDWPNVARSAASAQSRVSDTGGEHFGSVNYKYKQNNRYEYGAHLQLEQMEMPTTYV